MTHDPVLHDDAALATERLYEPPPDSDDLFAKAVHFTERLDAVKERGQYWFRRPLASASGPRAMQFDPATGKSREMLLFASNNYLGLATDPRVEASRAAARNMATAPLGGVFSGTTDLHLRLEAAIAAFTAARRRCSSRPATTRTWDDGAPLRGYVAVSASFPASIIDGCSSRAS
jgi:hypothetical protein